MIVARVTIAIECETIEEAKSVAELAKLVAEDIDRVRPVVMRAECFDTSKDAGPRPVDPTAN